MDRMDKVRPDLRKRLEERIKQSSKLIHQGRDGDYYYSERDNEDAFTLGAHLLLDDLIMAIEALEEISQDHLNGGGRRDVAIEALSKLKERQGL